MPDIGWQWRFERWEGAGVAFIAGCGQKKRAELLQAPLNARKEKKPCGLKDKNLEANNRFLNQEGS
ncbi:hypothetical protein [Aeromonas allosaccharophila]|uniref:hypothetical protein n=1 Tax=Aeromonas allosaccharophila TaxID=656 RepID=UPI003D25C09D